MKTAQDLKAKCAALLHVWREETDGDSHP